MPTLGIGERGKGKGKGKGNGKKRDCELSFDITTLVSDHLALHSRYMVGYTLRDGFCWCMLLHRWLAL